MKRFTKNLFLTAILLSLILHLGTGAVVFFKKLPTRSDKSVEIEIVEKPKTSNSSHKTEIAKQIVDQSEKRINDEIDEKTKFLSRYNQRVAEQTKAQQTGKFQNDAKMGEAKLSPDSKQVQEKQKQAKNSPKTKAKATATNPNGDVPLPKLADLQPQFHWDKNPMGVQDPGKVSQTDDYLKDMKTGPQTLLSSREFIYFSYYNRIKDRLRLFWEPKIKEKVNRIFMSGRHLASNEEKITRLVITLDRNGTLVNVQVLGPSGVQDLDEAAIEAFQLAAPFPNPPSGIIEADGTIKIHWDFILEANSSLFSPTENIATGN